MFSFMVGEFIEAGTPFLAEKLVTWPVLSQRIRNEQSEVGAGDGYKLQGLPHMACF